jgi:D-cysteine desulfhydrase
MISIVCGTTHSISITRYSTARFLFLLLLRMRPTASALTMIRKSHAAYQPPAWASAHFSNPPTNGRLRLANLPTPIYQLASPTTTLSPILQRFQDLNIKIFIKRDDMSGGIELGGNKIRKLEFLLADAISENYDRVVTIGGEQSNHCRATACAARMVGGLEPHLILRTKKDIGLVQEATTGNLLFNRMVGSSIYTCTPGEYGRIGSNALVERLCQHLDGQDEKKTYGIPVGGSNALGTWGYIEAIDELMHQWTGGEEAAALDHVVFSSGSGGTAAGISLGLALCPDLKGPRVHAVGVCDDPDYFYQHVSQIATDMGLKKEGILDFIKQSMTVHQGKGLGYAVATEEELAFCQQFAIETGIVLDPVYTGKALYHFVTHIVDETFRDSTVLFWHTGGGLGMYDKGDDLILSPLAKRLDVYGTKSSDDDEGVVSI